MGKLIRSATEKGANRNAAILRDRGVKSAQATAKAMEKKRQEKSRRG